MRHGKRRIAWIAGIAVALAAVIAVVGLAMAAEDAPPVPPGPVAPDDLQPRNIIVMISDGCGFHQWMAASQYEHGQDMDPLYESFPVRMGMSTYPAGGSYDPQKATNDFDYVDGGATDSAAAGTAIATGKKTYSGAIAVSPDKTPLQTAVDVAEAAGKASGVVTSVQFAHATPASFVAHNESRGNYEEIAREMILDSAADVIMGAGHPDWTNSAQPIEDDRDYKYVGGEETWQAVRSGTAGADADGDGEADPWTLVDDLAGFESIATGDAPSRVLGVAPVHTTLQAGRGGDGQASAFEVPLNENVPTLELITQGALNVLDEDAEGFFLMVEGGAVDWACHGNAAGRMIEEQMNFSDTVEAVIDWVESESSWDETLVVVTADHETGYLTGPDSDPECTAPVCRGTNVMPEIDWHSGGHTNSLVPFFARGPGASIFEQSAIANDPVRGPYIDNTFIGSLVISSMQ